MTYSKIFEFCNDIIEMLIDFAIEAYNFFTSSISLPIVGEVTVFEILTTTFFTYIVARIALNIITG